MTDRLDDLLDQSVDDEGPSSWEPVDLSDAVAGVEPPGPDLLARTDGACLLYRGRTHWFMGESESLKSWCAAVTAAQVLDAGGAVLWVDYEDDAQGVVSRLLALGTPALAILDRFTYLRPEEPLIDHRGRATVGQLALVAVLKAGPYDLAVVDGVTEAMATEGLLPNENADVATWMRRLPRRLAATGAAVVALDHLPKAKEAHGRFAIGGQHKLAGITGAAYRFDLQRPLARPHSVNSLTGSVMLTVTKDRPGHVRGRALGDRVGVLELTAWRDGGVTAALVPPDQGETADLALCRRLLEYLSDYDGASQRNLEEHVEGKGAAIRAALRWMAAEPRHWLEIRPVGTSHRHYLTEQGRAEL